MIRFKDFLEEAKMFRYAGDQEEPEGHNSGMKYQRHAAGKYKTPASSEEGRDDALSSYHAPIPAVRKFENVGPRFRNDPARRERDGAPKINTGRPLSVNKTSKDAQYGAARREAMLKNTKD